MSAEWGHIHIRVDQIGSGVIVHVAAGKDYADTALPNMHFPDLESGLRYVVEKASDPAQIIATGVNDGEHPF